MSNPVSIKLLQYKGDPTNTPFANQFSWPLTVVATGTNIDSNVFVYRMGGTSFDPVCPPGDTFSCVASVNQMYELPTSPAAAVIAGTHYYRRATLDLVCRSAAELEYIWGQVQIELNDLIINFNAAGMLSVANTVVLDGGGIGSPTTTPYFTLAAVPAGSITISGSTTISAPQTNLAGWLPASIYSGAVPPNGLFYYNMALQSALAAQFPVSTPYTNHQLLRSGVPMPYGTVFVLDTQTIWWLQFNPGSVPDYPDSSPYPWSADYQSPTNPGTPLDITFVI